MARKHASSDPSKGNTMVATATAHWTGSLDEGSGSMSTATGLEGAFTKASRFADGAGTNPEELIGAAHAGCFSMFLSALLSKNGTPPNAVDTTAKVSIISTDDGPVINRIDLSTVVDVDLSEDEINSFAEKAKTGCPVSKALASVETVTLKVAKA